MTALEHPGKMTKATKDSQHRNTFLEASVSSLKGQVAVLGHLLEKERRDRMDETGALMVRMEEMEKQFIESM